MIKMIAMDFDWTLVDYTDTEASIGRELIDTMSHFIDEGGYAGIVSGRQFWEFQGEFKRMGLPWSQPFPNYIIGREAYVYGVEGNEYKDVGSHNSETKKKIMTFNREMLVYVNDILVLYEKNNIPVSNFFVYGDFAIEIHTTNDAANLAMNLAEEYITEKKIEDAAVHRNGVMVTIYNKCAGKGNALMVAANHFGVKPEEVLAIGDSYNDLSMIDGHLGFVGACVGNADDRLKEIVRQNGGYVGNGTAYKGIMDILNNLKILNRIDI